MTNLSTPIFKTEHEKIQWAFDHSPWMTTAEAAAYTKRRSREAFRKWARRRGLVQVDGRYDRRDIDAVLSGKRR